MFFSKKDKKETEKKPREMSIFREYFEMVSEVLVFVFFINTFLLQSQAIPTSSMEDTMLIGDHLLVNKVAYSPYLFEFDRAIFPRVEIERGMVVTFKGPPEMDKDYVKRVIGLPGETIRITDKKVYINDEPLDEPYTFFKGIGGPSLGDNYPMQYPRIIDSLGNKSHLPFYLNYPGDGRMDEAKTADFCKRFDSYVFRNDALGVMEFKIPEGHYFCMGDNRDNSHDSRFWGPLPEAYIIGQPWRVYWSYSSQTAEYLTPGFIHKIKDFFSTALHFFTRTRWNRTFKRCG